MKNIDKKVIRELSALKYQTITISLVVASGVAIFIASQISYRSLWNARAKFYSSYFFSQGFVSLRNAPESIKRKLEEISGIGSSRTRIIQEGIIDFPEEVLPTSGKFVSLTKGMNELSISSGRLPETNNEVIISEAFALANHLKPGNKISAILSGNRKQLVITGTALSPEFVYIFRPSSFLPDDKHYGIFWMQKEGLENAFHMEGAFNDVIFTFSPEANERSTLKAIDNVLEKYGGYGAYDREKLPSHSFLRDEFKQLRTTAVMIPMIFLGVAAFLLHMVSTRLISREREQIATLKALGYKDIDIALHYIKLISFISSIGSITGIFFGIYLGDSWTAMYGEFYRFPGLKAEFNLSVALEGYALGILAGIIGAAFSIHKVLKLDPASAMRPPIPQLFKKNPIERLTYQFNGTKKAAIVLSTISRIIIRNLFQKPIRTMLTSLGISSAVMIMIVGTFSTDTINTMLDIQFNLLQRESVTLTFINPVSSHAITEISGQEGVLHTEGYRMVPIRIRVGHKSKEMLLQGIPQNSELRRLIDKDKKILEPTDSGLLINSVVAEKMGITRGQKLELEILEGNRKKVQITVEGTIDEILGQGAYMSRSGVSRLLGEGNSVNLIAVRTDPKQEDMLLKKLKYFPKIAGISTRSGTLKVFNDLMARTTLATSLILLIFAMVIAVGVVYNTAMISLAERAFELGSLRIMGFTNFEVFKIIAGELTVITILALPLGSLLGYLFAYLMFQTVDTEGFSFPLVITMRTYGYALFMTVITALISFFIIFRKLKSMDLISILKIRE